MSNDIQATYIRRFLWLSACYLADASGTPGQAAPIERSSASTRSAGPRRNGQSRAAARRVQQGHRLSVPRAIKSRLSRIYWIGQS